MYQTFGSVPGENRSKPGCIVPGLTLSFLESDPILQDLYKNGDGVTSHGTQALIPLWYDGVKIYGSAVLGF